jgi:hypothetical protein
MCGDSVELKDELTTPMGFVNPETFSIPAYATALVAMWRPGFRVVCEVRAPIMRQVDSLPGTVIPVGSCRSSGTTSLCDAIDVAMTRFIGRCDIPEVEAPVGIHVESDSA